MQPARPLRDVFDELARGDAPADRSGALADSGHGDLPDTLVSEAIVNYADTAPVEVAEHLAPFVKAHSAVPTGDTGATDPAADRGLDLLATAPEHVVFEDRTDGAPDERTDGGDTEPSLEYAGPAGGDISYGGDPGALDFAFGSGADDGAGEGVPHVEEPEQEPVVHESDGDLIAPAPAVPNTSDETVGWASPVERVPPDEGEDEEEVDPGIGGPGG